MTQGTDEGGAPAEAVAGAGTQGDGHGVDEGPLVSFETAQAYDIVEYRQTALSEFPPDEEWFENNIKTMDQAEAFARILLEVGERVQLTLGGLVLHVDKGQPFMVGGRRELARRLEMPNSTLDGWAASAEGKRYVESSCPHVRTRELPIKHYEQITRSPEPEKTVEFIAGAVEETGKLPTYREVVEKVKEQRMAKFYQRLDENPTTRNRPDNLRYTNVWNFPNARYEYDKGHDFGIAFSEVLEHILYYFTEPGDLIVDPMAGTGPSARICKEYERRCLMYDIEPKNGVEHNDLTLGLPEEAHGCNHIYLDPPYFNIRVDGAFNDDVEEFYKFIRTIGEHCYNTLQKGGTLSFVMMDKTKGDYVPLMADCYRILWNIGFECIATIQSPYPENVVSSGYQTNYARENRKLIGQARIIYIFRRPA